LMFPMARTQNWRHFATIWMALQAMRTFAENRKLGRHVELWWWVIGKLNM
jgi:hypothetical protein